MEKDGVPVMGIGGGFQKRFFVLRDSVLKYFEPGDIKMNDLKGEIHMHNALNVSLGDDQLTITVLVSNKNNEQRLYHLRAARKDVARDWHTKLYHSTTAGFAALMNDYERRQRAFEIDREKKEMAKAWRDAELADEAWHSHAKQVAANQNRAEKLRGVFDRLDVDGNGELTASELIQGFRSESMAERVLRDCDVNNDGVVSFEEWKEFIYAQSKVPKAKAKSKTVFGKTTDLNRNVNRKQNGAAQAQLKVWNDERFNEVLTSIASNLDNSMVEQF